MLTLKRCDLLADKDKDTETSDRVAVLPLLSNNGKTAGLVRSNREDVSFDIVRGKHLAICRVELPLGWDAGRLYSMIDAYNNLPPSKFEMVIVPTLAVDKPAFDDFFFRLPCLSIPFDDVDTRDSICSFIARHVTGYPRQVSAILLDPEGVILHPLRSMGYFVKYGYELFPFRPSDTEAISMQDRVLRFRLDPFFKEDRRQHAPEAVMGDPLLEEPLSLDKDILLCDPSLLLTRNGGYYEQPLTVSELSKKHVALYLCYDGLFLPNLIDVHEECIANKLELEILLVYVPDFHDRLELREGIIRELRHNNITSWFVFPEPNKVWRRLWRAFGEYYEDKVIILAPNGNPGELMGNAIIEEFGIAGYPFTRSTIRERRFTHLRSLTPASLFQGTSKNRTSLVRKGKRLNVLQSALEGKNLLVYLDWLQPSDDRLCGLLMKLYPRIRAMGWEVIFVPFDVSGKGKRDIKFDEMLWPIMPVRAAVKAGVTRQLLFLCPDQDCGRQVIAFREDGKIVSREVQKRLSEHSLNDSLFSDNLYEEITKELIVF